MKKVKLYCFFIIWMIFSCSYAQDISFTASAPNKVPVGQRFTLTYSLNAEVKNINLPKFDNFTLLGGPFPSIHQEVYFVNNQMTQMKLMNFVCHLKSNEQGTYKIPSATCEINGKKYTSNELTITIVENSGQAQAPPQSQPQPGVQNLPQRKNANQPVTIDDKSFFLKVTADKTNVYQGEEVMLTYRIYTLIPIQYELSKLPASKGFWIEELNGKNIPFKQFHEYIDGKQYSVAEIRKVVLFPQESGSLTVPPLEIDVLAQINTFQNLNLLDLLFDDPFFSNLPQGFGSQQTVRKSIKSNTLTINVSKLPKTPDEFTGGVGNFTIKSLIDKTRLKAHEALKYTITLSGKGNLMLIDKLNIQFPHGFEAYDPKITSNVNKDANGINGSKTFEWVIIPRNEGTYQIPALDFVFFDVKNKRFQTIKTNVHEVHVEKGDPNLSLTHTSTNQKEVEILNNDIEFIKVQPSDLKAKSRGFFNSSFFYISLISIIVIFFTTLILWKKYDKRRNNINLMRLKHATQIAKKRLTTAEKLLKERNNTSFYEEIANILWGYVSDKFLIPLSELSMDSVQDALLKKDLDSRSIHEIIDILSKCEYARFAPGVNNGEDMGTIYNQAIQIIENLETQLKKTN